YSNRERSRHHNAALRGLPWRTARLHAPRNRPAGFAGRGGSGTIKTVTKQSNGSITIKFTTEKHQEMSRSCTPSNRIFRIADNGIVEYYQNCKDTGLVWVDTTPDDVTIPADFAANIATGNVAEFEATRGTGEQRWAFPPA